MSNPLLLIPLVPLPQKFRIPLCCIVDKGSHDGSDLFEISFDQVIIDIHVAVVGVGIVFDFILDELKARESHRIE